MLIKGIIVKVKNEIDIIINLLDDKNSIFWFLISIEQNNIEVGMTKAIKDVK